MNEINLSLKALKASYQNKVFEPRSLLSKLREQALAQADYNAWITLLSMEELEPFFQLLDGKTPDELPLYGVPFAIKDNIDLAGITTTAGCPDFSYVAQQSAPVVSALIKAGAIPLGKTNLDQFATGLVGTRSPYGQGKNVFNSEYISGGSSAGSAIATALGQVSFALGTDTAGSGRVPAVLNNLIGLKPTKGLLSTNGVVPACRSLDCVSIFALVAEDAATIFDVAANYDANDAYARKNTYSNISRYFSSKISEPFTFGVPSELEFENNDECRSLYEKAVAALETLGGKPVSIDFTPFLNAAKLLYEGPWVAERWLATREVAAESMLPVISDIIGPGSTASAGDTFAAYYRLSELKRECDNIVNQLDVVLTPTTPTFYTRKEIDADPIKHNSILGTYTNFMNLLDYCAVAVPIGSTVSKVHWGITLFHSAFTDIRLLNIASALQNHFAHSLGATGFSLAQNTIEIQAPSAPAFIDVVVCGAHLEGQPLNWQLAERNATLVAKTKSSTHYKLFALKDGKRPAMVRSDTDGQAIEVEVWRVPQENFGSFVAGIPSPLGIGKVELANGFWLSGFICDAHGLNGAQDITAFGGWRAWLRACPH